MLRLAISLTALSALAVPAAAQDVYVSDNRYASVAQPTQYTAPLAYEGYWMGTYTDLEGRLVDAELYGTFVDPDRFVAADGTVIYRIAEREWYEDIRDSAVRDADIRPARRAIERPTVTRLAYSPEQRAQWLAQCRAVRGGDVRYVEAGRDRDRGLGESGIIGSLLGAIAGGVVGNRVADGERLAGTLIGAGVGGLAGAVIGSAIGGSGDDDDEVVYVDDDYAMDYCEAYLLNYERGYGEQQYIAVIPANQPVQRDDDR